MQVTIQTPPTKITATCAQCGFPIYAKGVTATEAQRIFKAQEWSEDEHGRATCPDCCGEMEDTP